MDALCAPPPARDIGVRPIAGSAPSDSGLGAHAASGSESSERGAEAAKEGFHGMLGDAAQACGCDTVFAPRLWTFEAAAQRAAAAI
jgi:hypothetical protein